MENASELCAHMLPPLSLRTPPTLALLLALSSCQRAAATALSHASNNPAAHAATCDCALPSRDFERHDACLQRDGDAYRMQPSVLDLLTHDEQHGPFDVYSQCGLFWVRADGLARSTPNFDNGPDPFREGVTRYLKDGKYGYMDATLNVLVAPRYDFAYPFQDGKGVVCEGCTFRAEGEHTTVDCARCGAVNRAGVLVEPLSAASRIDELLPHRWKPPAPTPA